MDSFHKFLLIPFLTLALAFDGTSADAIVTGTVFCDQCKDEGVSLFDYPLSGVKVAVACADSNGQITMWREETTNWFGSYSMKFDGTLGLSSCHAQVIASSGPGWTGCGAVAGPARYLKLIFRIWDMEMYTVDALISQPSEPMTFCPRSPYPLNPTRPPSPVPVPVIPIRPPNPVNPSPFRFLPMPHLPPMPPVPFVEASACPHEKWAMPEYNCYWKAVDPNTKVSVVFGIVAARRYGNDITLWQGLQGRGDPYRTLLREGTTALLNSYNSLRFPYHNLGVIQRMDWALIGTPQDVLLTALQFKRINSGSSGITCKLTPCK